MRRGQISVFIILGLTVLVVLALAIFLYQTYVKGIDPEIEQQYIVRGTIEPVKRYVETCLSQVGKPIPPLMAVNGGTLEPRVFRWYNHQRYHYLCVNDQAACMNTLLLRQDMERELEEWIEDNLTRCLNMEIFERQGFDVQGGVPSVNVTIGRSDILVQLHYPVRLTNRELDLSVSDYKITLPTPLGFLYDLAVEIINAENTRGYFDQVDYMVHNGYRTHIDKHRPYPDIVYNLSTEGFEFHFALQGRPTTQSEELVRPPDVGCCYNLYDKNCFKNVPESLCKAKRGIYDFNAQCVCPETANTNEERCNGKVCRDCPSTYNYVTKQFTLPGRKHGESWCGYEAIAGRGYDYVGSRHYLHYCIDGIEYVEECRDYRDELCTEETITKNGIAHSKALCRINRWYDCAGCATEECCEDTTYRDCHWKEWLTTEQKCVPYVPPGFPFWISEGREVCSRATQIRECSGFSCPNIWVDDTAVYCYMQGDCGNYRNVNDRLTKQGFFNSDLHDTVRDYVYLNDGETKKGNSYHINLGIDNRRQAPLLKGALLEVEDNFIRLFTVGMRYIETVSSLSVSDILRMGTGQVKVLDIAACDIWQPPYGGDDCSKCVSDYWRLCSEYKCKSLGKLCEYEEREGVPFCYTRSTQDKIPPVIMVNSTQPGYTLKPSTLKIEKVVYRGYEVIPGIRPYHLLTLTVNTSEETTCKLRYTPMLKYVNLPSFYFGDARMATVHNITLRIPGKLELPQKLLDLFNLTSAKDIVGMLQEPQRLFDAYKSRYADQLTLFQSVTGRDLVALVEPHVERLGKVISELSEAIPFYRTLFETLIEQFEAGRYYLFIECKDRAGNVNKEEIFVSFYINETDNEPPMILGFYPENDTLVASEAGNIPVSMYVDEPAECRYDTTDKGYGEMAQAFTCPTSPYTMSARFGGSYECTGAFNVTGNMFYIRCTDNPQRRVQYPLKIVRGTTAAINGVPPTKYLNVTPPATIWASSSYLQEGITFEVTENDVAVHVFFDDLKNCSLDYGGKAIPFTECRNISSLELGLYECVTSLRLIDNGTQITPLSLRVTVLDDGLPNDVPGVVVSGDLFTVNQTLAGTDITLHASAPSTVAIEFNGWFACPGMSCGKFGNMSRCTVALGTGTSTLFECAGNPLAGQGTLHEATITCTDKRQKPRHTNERSTEYMLGISAPLSVVSAGPEGEIETGLPTLFIETTPSSGIECGYYRDLMMGTLRMESVNATRFEATVETKSGTNTFYITCNDAYGNTLMREVNFVVIG